MNSDKLFEIKSICSYFHLPIEYLDLNEQKKVPFHIVKDLELNELIDSDLDEKEKDEEKENNSLSIYEQICHPTTLLGKEITKVQPTLYTTNTTFLKDTQQLLQSIDEKDKKIVMKSEIKEKMIQNYDEIKNDTGFKGRYQYMDWESWDHLNHSESFLQIMSISSVASPLLSLLYPILILIIPFILIKTMGHSLDMTSYMNILSNIASQNCVGKLCTQFFSVSWEEKIYLLMMVFFYFFSLYQNTMTCYRFHCNMKKIHCYLKEIEEYIDITENEMNQFYSLSSSLPSYHLFCINMKQKQQELVSFKKQIQTISDYKGSFTFQKMTEYGRIMKLFYQIHQDSSLHETIMYSFGFHGYIETIFGLQTNIKQKYMHFASFDTNEKQSDDEQKNNDDEEDEQNDDDDEEKEQKDEEEEQKDDEDEDEQKEKNKDIKKNIKNGCRLYGLYYPPHLYNTTCVTNDILLDKHMIITGPNASGKTTILKSTLINVLLTQQYGCGFYKNALFPFLFDHVHCYLNIPDTSGRDSLFQAEARRCKDILDHIHQYPNEYHLCVFDELYSGTNPEEAVTSATAFMQYLATYPKVTCMLTTHFYEVCYHLEKEKEKQFQNVCMKTTTILDKKQQQYNDFVYTYQLQEGISKIKGGMKVLYDMNYPKDILNKCSLSKPIYPLTIPLH